MCQQDFSVLVDRLRSRGDRGVRLTTHIADRHTDRTRLAAYRYVTKRAVEHEYGALPARMRLVVLPIFSTFGAIGTPGHAFIGELSRCMVPLFPTPYSPTPLGPPPASAR